MFPSMLTPLVDEAIPRQKGVLGWKLSGAGGGGYVIVVSDEPLHRRLRFRFAVGTTDGDDQTLD